VSEGNGNGNQVLRAILNGAIDMDAVNDTRSSLSDYTVLSPQNDPYRLDLPDNHHNGQWFAEVLNRLAPHGAIHLRGLHYRIVAAADVVRPDNGLGYINSNECWEWLMDKASKQARWLGYVPFWRIIDERNDAPEVFIPDQVFGRWVSISGGTTVELPDDISLPRLYGSGFDVGQPYRIVFFGEKTSLRSVLLPIAGRVRGELLLPTGEASSSMVAAMVHRASLDTHPTVVLYFSDFDPSGYQMSISVSRKIQALRDLLYPELNIQVHHVALTIQQVRELQLPSTPLKDTEKRADRWRARWGHEQTEIDALAALRSDDLSEIAYKAIEPFFDLSLASRSRQASSDWHREAQQILESHPEYQTRSQAIQEAFDAVKDAVEELKTAQADAVTAFNRIATTLPRIVAPEIELDPNVPEPIFTTTDDFATASRRLIARKALET
jgi:hypothetical protein